MADPSSTEDPRLTILRRLCREVGPLSERVKTVDDLLLSSEVINHDLWGELGRIVKMSVRWVPESEFVRAAANALGLTSTGNGELDPSWNLTARRRHFLAFNPGLSERTLIRHELIGLGHIAQTMDKVQEAILEGLSEPATKAEVASLRRRVGELEAAVAEISRLVQGS